MNRKGEWGQNLPPKFEIEGQQTMKIAPRARKKPEKRAPESLSPKEDSGRKATKRRREEQEVTVEYALEVRKVSVHHPGDELVVEVADPGGEDDP